MNPESGAQASVTAARDESWRFATAYDAEYYEHSLGDPYRWDVPSWKHHFAVIAAFVVREFAPRTVLDVGCGVGFFVAALRADGVDARGFDISEFAISQVPSELRPYCYVGSVTEPIEGRYDLISCIEVLEHLPPALADRALDNLTSHTDRVLFSSSPVDVTEPTHLNVQAPDVWVRAFAERGFYPAPCRVADFVAPQALVFERGEPPVAELAARYEVERFRVAQELVTAREQLREAERAGAREPGRAAREAQRLQRELAAHAELLERMLSTLSWRVTYPARWMKASVRDRLEPLTRKQLVRKAESGLTDRRRRRTMRNLLSPEWYEARYGPFPEGTDLLEHYLRVGGQSGNDPSPLFDTAWYREHYLPAAEHPTVLEHFIREGMHQGARPNRYFDPRLWIIHERRGNERLEDYLAGVGRALSDPRVLQPGGNPVTTVVEGRIGIADGDEFCVYAHYDPEAVVDGYVVSTLRALAAAGLRTVFVSTCSELPRPEIAKIHDCTAFVLTTRNEGRDWGLYHAGLRFVLERVAPVGVILMNDSVYTHADLLRTFIASAVQTNANVIGATDSYQQAYHLQSYFLRLDRTTLTSGVVDEFLEHYTPVADKRYIINAYEIGFSRRAADHGLSLEAAYPYDDLAGAALQSALDPSIRELVITRMALNPTHYLGDVLIDEGCPFVKVELLRDNPQAVDLARLTALLEDGGGEKWGRPLDHLRRLRERGRVKVAISVS